MWENCLYIHLEVGVVSLGEPRRWKRLPAHLLPLPVPVPGLPALVPRLLPLVDPGHGDSLHAHAVAHEEDDVAGHGPGVEGGGAAGGAEEVQATVLAPEGRV